MNKLHFMDNITTSARWKSEALDNVAEKPKLNRWQTAGVIVGTAVAMASMAVMPIMFKGNAPKAAVGSPPDAEITAEEDVSETETVVNDPIDPEEFGQYKNVVGKIKNDFDFLEIVTVLDCEYTEDGDILLAAAKDSGTKRLFCTTIAADSADYSEDDFGDLSFGDRIALGYQTMSKENMSVEMPVNDSTYNSEQPAETSQCSGFAYLGISHETMFRNVLHSAEAATGAPYNGYNNDTIKLVQSHYRNMGKVTPLCSTNRMWSGPYYKFKDYYMNCLNTLYDDNYTADGVASQLYVMEIAVYDSSGAGDEAAEMSLYRDGGSGEYILNICGVEYGVYVSSHADIEVLDIRLTKGVSPGNMYYLLVNVIDAKHTGNIYDDLDISVYSEQRDKEVKKVPENIEVEISSVDITGDELSVKIDPSDSLTVHNNGVEVYTSYDVEIYELMYYTFEITPEVPVENVRIEHGNLSNILYLYFDDSDEPIDIESDSGHDIISVVPDPVALEDGTFRIDVVVSLRRTVGEKFEGETFRFMEFPSAGGTASIQTISFEGDYID